MGLGDKAAAFKLIDDDDVIPSRKMPWGAFPLRSWPECRRAREPDRAIAALQKLLSIPCDGALAQNVPLTPALLGSSCSIRFGTIRASKARIGRGEIIMASEVKKRSPRIGASRCYPLHPLLLCHSRVSFLTIAPARRAQKGNLDEKGLKLPRWAAL
jgi:hypothetical protein